DAEVGFDPVQLWAAEPVDTVFEGGLGDYPGYFSGYDYARDQYTDSAAAGTALASGNKTYNSAINWSNLDAPLTHIGELTVESGRSLAVISSVQWTHATPASSLGHNRNRNEYSALANEVIETGLATVVMGSGHPYFDADGEPVESPADSAFNYVG